jgi:hypothetical protein
LWALLLLSVPLLLVVVVVVAAFGLDERWWVRRWWPLGGPHPCEWPDPTLMLP